MSFLNDNFISRFFITVIEFFYSFTGDYVLAALLFTIVIKILLLPLDIKQKKSTQRMQDIAPKMNALRERYKNDPQKLQAATRELYKKENVKQSSGCLLALLQFPILFAMFGAISILSRVKTVELVVGLSQDPTLLPESFLWVHNIWQPDTGIAHVMPSFSEYASTLSSVASKLDPATLATAQQIVDMSALQNFATAMPHIGDQTVMGSLFTQAYQSIPQSTVDFSATFNYATVAAPVLLKFENYRNGFFLFPLLAGVSQFVALWYTSKKQAAAGQPQQGMTMQLIMPIIIAYFACTTGTLFAMYYTVSSLWSFGQQFIMDVISNRKKTALDVAE